MFNGLLHIIIIQHLTPIIDGNKSILITPIGFGITLILAIVSFNFFEKPIIKQSHKFKY